MMGQYLIVVGLLGAVLILLIQKFKKLFAKHEFWEKYGVPELNTPNFAFCLLKTRSFVDTYATLYKEAGNMKFGGLYDSGRNMVLIKDLDLAKQILVKDFDHFVNRSDSSFGSNDSTWSKIIISKADKEWRDLRMTMSPTFTSGKLRRLFPILVESADKLRSHINKIVKENKQLIIEDALGLYCLDSIVSLAFGIESDIFKNENSFLAENARKSTIQFTPYVYLRTKIFGFLPKWLRRFEPPLINESINKIFVNIILETIQQREKSGNRRDDFLQLMLDAKQGKLKNDDGEAELTSHEKDAQLNDDDNNAKEYTMTNDVIAANSLQFIFGGYDTVKSAILFASYSLATNPHIQEKLRKELQNAIDENGGELSYDIVNVHEYLNKVTCEVLRIYPSGVGFDRMCVKDYPIPGTKSFIPKGSIILMPVQQIHLDEKHFPNPTLFDPERFSPEVKATRHPYAHMPFGHGPRSCIANRLALVMVKTALANIVLNFYLEPTAETDIPLKFTGNVSLKTTKPTKLKLIPI